MTAPLEVFVGIGHAPPCGEGKVWLSRAPGEGIRFQLELVGLDRLTVELDRIESVLPSPGLRVLS